MGARIIELTEATPGNIIGACRLLELINEGGMRQVWPAEQKQPVRSRVAIKPIKGGHEHTRGRGAL